MKTLVCSVMTLSFAVSMAGRVHGRNVELLVPIADALAATDVSDRPTGVVKFFFAAEKPPAILKNLGSYLARPGPAPRAGLTSGPITMLFSGHL